MQSPRSYFPPEPAAEYLGLSGSGKSYLAKLRTHGGGPKFLRLSPRKIVYHKDDLDAWAASRQFRSTSEY